MPGHLYDPKTGTLTRVGGPATRSVLDFGNPPDLATTPHTEMTVQLTLSSKAHPDDVAAVIERLQAAIKDATAATGGRLDIEFALPEIVRE
jgi:hypothetical protein